MNSFDLRDAGCPAWLHQFHAGLFSTSPSGEEHGLPAVQAERAVQREVAMIRALYGILLQGFCQRVHQAPAGRLCELFVGRLFKLAKDRDDVRRIDDAELGGSDDTAAGFIVVLQVGVLQLLADRFDSEEVILKRSSSPVDEFGQIKPARVSALDDGRTAEREVATNADHDTSNDKAMPDEKRQRRSDG